MWFTGKEINETEDWRVLHFYVDLAEGKQLPLAISFFMAFDELIL